jgi:hypothetical protein
MYSGVKMACAASNNSCVSKRKQKATSRLLCDSFTKVITTLSGAVTSLFPASRSCPNMRVNVSTTAALTTSASSPSDAISAIDRVMLSCPIREVYSEWHEAQRRNQPKNGGLRMERAAIRDGTVYFPEAFYRGQGFPTGLTDQRPL